MRLTAQEPENRTRKQECMNPKCIAIIFAMVGMCGRAGISQFKEGSAQEAKSDRQESTKTTESGWRETFNVDKEDLAPIGNNPYLPIQPGKVLKLSHGNDRLTVAILPGTKTVDGVP